MKVSSLFLFFLLCVTINANEEFSNQGDEEYVFEEDSNYPNQIFPKMNQKNLKKSRDGKKKYHERFIPNQANFLKDPQFLKSMIAPKNTEEFGHQLNKLVSMEIKKKRNLFQNANEKVSTFSNDTKSANLSINKKKEDIRILLNEDEKIPQAFEIKNENNSNIVININFFKIGNDKNKRNTSEIFDSDKMNKNANYKEELQKLVLKLPRELASSGHVDQEKIWEQVKQKLESQLADKSVFAGAHQYEDNMSSKNTQPGRNNISLYSNDGNVQNDSPFMISNNDPSNSNKAYNLASKGFFHDYNDKYQLKDFSDRLLLKKEHLLPENYFEPSLIYHRSFMNPVKNDDNLLNKESFQFIKKRNIPSELISPSEANHKNLKNEPSIFEAGKNISKISIFRFPMHISNENETSNSGAILQEINHTRDWPYSKLTLVNGSDKNFDSVYEKIQDSLNLLNNPMPINRLTNGTTINFLDLGKIENIVNDDENEFNINNLIRSNQPSNDGIHIDNEGDYVTESGGLIRNRRVQKVEIDPLTILHKIMQNYQFPDKKRKISDMGNSKMDVIEPFPQKHFEHTNNKLDEYQDMNDTYSSLWRPSLEIDKNSKLLLNLMNEMNSIKLNAKGNNRRNMKKKNILRNYNNLPVHSYIKNHENSFQEADELRNRGSFFSSKPSDRIAKNQMQINGQDLLRDESDDSEKSNLEENFFPSEPPELLEDIKETSLELHKLANKIFSQGSDDDKLDKSMAKDKRSMLNRSQYKINKRQVNVNPNHKFENPLTSALEDHEIPIIPYESIKSSVRRENSQS